MKDFFKTFFAAFAGVLVGLFLISMVSMMMLGGVVGSISTTPTYTLKDKTILKLDLNGLLSDREGDSPLNSLMGTKSIGIDNIVEAIQKAKENDKIKGIYIRCAHLTSGVASLEPIRKALIDFKDSQKFIVAYADSYSQPTYYVASVADKVILNPKGSFDFQGMSRQVQFQRGMYEKMGVKYQVFKVGTFKSAVEPYIQDQMSEANREQTISYLNDAWSYFLTNISESRNIPVEKLNEYADKYLGFYEADSILQFGMVDTLMYISEVDKYLKDLTETEEKEKLRLTSVKNMQGIDAKEKDSKDKIAILYAEGTIVPDDYSSNLISGSTITAKQYVKELQALKNDEDVKAVVFRVNSGGGSAYVSEQIWHAVSELKKVKPVVVSMGDYAASGGYYISCAATSIVAEPTTLTGSIGIFGLIPEGEELAKKMGVTFDEVKTNKHSGLGNNVFGIPFVISAYSKAFTEDENQMLQKYIESGYDLFITRCAEGRSMSNDSIDAIGQGRVWTGSQALAIGLVDKLGGIDDAVKIAAEAAELENYALKNYPEKTNLITELLNTAMGGTKIQALQLLVGEDKYKEQLYRKVLETTEINIAEMPERILF